MTIAPHSEGGSPVTECLALLLRLGLAPNCVEMAVERVLLRLGLIPSGLRAEAALSPLELSY